MKKLLLSFLLLLTVSLLNAQDSRKNLSPETLIPVTQTGFDILNTGKTFPQDQSKINLINELSAKLDIARDNGNIMLQREIENRINSLTNTTPVQSMDLEVVSNAPSGNIEDNIGINRVAIGDVWAQATTTQNTNGRIWIASTHYAIGITDTLKIFYSDNGGVSWNVFQSMNFLNNTVDFITDDLDIEVVYSGTNWWVFVSGSFFIEGNITAFVSRWKEDGTNFSFNTLPQSAGTDQYWTRIVSDYPRFTSNAYLMISATMDSSMAGDVHALFTRAFVIQNPFDAVPTVLNKNNNMNGSSYGYGVALGDTSILRTDIGYFDSLASGNKVVTISSFENSPVDNILFLTYSTNYMNTIPAYTQNINTPFPSLKPVIAYNSGNDQIKGAITYISKFNIGDWDPRYIVTDNGGATWTQQYLEASGILTTKSDVISLKGIDGQFKFGWNNASSPNPSYLYSSCYYSGSFAVTNPVQMDGSGVYANPIWGGRAGYKLTGSDSCLAVYGSSNTQENVYAAIGCSGPVTNVTGSELPANYSLSQNYPNPFNPSTNIRFEIPKAGFVKLAVYDILGKEVATLVNDRKEAGSFLIDFDAAGLSSGIYFYKLTTAEFTDIKKMTLIK